MSNVQNGPLQGSCIGVANVLQFLVFPLISYDTVPKKRQRFETAAAK